MKKSFLGIAALFLAVTLVFAFKPIGKKLTTTFYLQAGQDKFDPSKYSTSSVSCSGSGNVCSVIVEDNEIYTSGQFAGKPMVNDNTKQVHIDVDQLTSAVTQRN